MFRFSYSRFLPPFKNWPTFKATYATEAVLKCDEVKLHRLQSGPKTEDLIKKDEALDLLRKMHIIRKMENQFANLYKAKLVRGFCHLYAGQEAIAVGMKSRMGPNDTCITAYRCHGWTYVMGCSVHQIGGEMIGRACGIAKGKGGSMHLYETNFYGGNGIVGAHIPLGTGVAFKHKYTNDGNVCVAAYGDGAANQGQISEAFNIAKLLNLPIIYVVENNRFGMGTSDIRASANIEFYTRGDYIPGIWTNGMDIVAVRTATDFAKQYIKEGKGPIIIEMYTYRYYGHSMSDSDTTYRTRDDIKKVRETRDPINMFKGKLLESKLATEDELKTVEADAKKEVDTALDKIKSEKELPLAELTYDVYSLNLEGPIRLVRYDVPGEHKVLGQAVNRN